MRMTKKEYKDYTNSIAPKSPLGRNLFHAFWVGGLICCLGQFLQNGFSAMGLEKTMAGTAASCSLVFLSALLTGFSLYDDIAKFAGAGTLVPITGFSNAIAAPAIEFQSEGWITGMAVKMFTIAGPVLVYGTTASVLYGLIYWLCSL